MPRCTMSVPVSKPIRIVFGAPLDARAPLGRVIALRTRERWASAGGDRARSTSTTRRPDESGRDAAPGGFYFRKLGQQAEPAT